MRTHSRIMKNIFGLLVSTILVFSVHQVYGAEFRAPAVPLVTHDPYFSIWLMADHLTDQPTKDWTGAVQSLSSLVHVDGKTYRMMGTEPKGVPILPQTHLDVLPTHTAYQFEGGGIHVSLTFLNPGLPQDLEMLSPASDLRDVACPVLRQ